MIGALVWKEWLKVRGAYLLLWVLHLAAGTCAVVALRSLFAGAHPEMVWYQAAILGNTPFDIFRHLPWAGGLLLAGAQHLPEIRDKRLRLTLHLPVPLGTVILCGLGVGAGLGLSLAAFDLGLVVVASLGRFPLELAMTQALALLPLEAAGMATYLGATCALFEPTTPGRIHLLLLTALSVAVFLVPAAPGAWASIPALALGGAILACLAVVPFLAVSRQRLTGKNQ
ncbi:hypothetical protein [Desulfolutivibrio sulfoxidireducens]|uniref:hypothetical protein n=1 Tax=Desulfolutivibrio sulfoxidireducens TaxID=2773299 RepID=UPI00159D4DFB|nr:hypothetical protein [Desulfolutivibrio sulfoxidireducens]QLA16112.1 hypothetical protein GD605_08215 [Desulfolutivibrio sulfoxidireducens]QLA19989.1 hypothetical protein GD604_09740 [Desulfolutivibrio sulfoxidireducens]